MIGHCPNCEKEIMKIAGQKVRILGNYRSIKFSMSDGSTMEVGMCSDCHDRWNENTTDDFLKTKMNKFLEKVYENDGPKRIQEVKNYYNKNKIVGIARKMGSLKSSEIKGARIWQ